MFEMKKYNKIINSLFFIQTNMKFKENTCKAFNFFILKNLFIHFYFARCYLSTEVQIFILKESQYQINLGVFDYLFMS